MSTFPQFLLILSLTLSFSYGKPVDNSPKWNKRGQVVFLGDSITDWWDSNDGIDTWNQFYEPLGTVNTGVAGDTTSDVINRINNQGIIDNLHAYVAVLKIGTNDLARGVPESTVISNIGTILDLIRAKNPAVKILLLGILPRGGAEIHGRIRSVNAQIEGYAARTDVWFLDMEAQFSTGLGQVIPNLYWPDQLHLSADGYVVWAATMNPLFNQILHSPFPAKAVWLGDSLTSQWWSTGIDVWNQHYAFIQSMNTAVSGHTSVDTLDLIERDGMINGLNSKVAMLMIGGNDLADFDVEVEAIVGRITRIIQLIKEKIPHVRVLLMGLLPAGGKPEWMIEKGKQVNVALAQMENNDDVRYLDMLAQFADDQENIHEELYQPDQTHLSALGYEVWQATMNPLFQELLQFNN